MSSLGDLIHRQSGAAEISKFSMAHLLTNYQVLWSLGIVSLTPVYMRCKSATRLTERSKNCILLA